MPHPLGKTAESDHMAEVKGRFVYHMIIMRLQGISEGTPWEQQRFNEIPYLIYQHRGVLREMSFTEMVIFQRYFPTELLPPLPAGDYLDNHSYLSVTIDLSHPLPPPSLPPLPSLTPSPSTTRSSCPFARLVYLTSVDEAGLSLVARILDLVNDLNTAALGLGDLPRDMLPTALSTYKLTK